MSAYDEIKESYHQKVISNLRTFEKAVSKTTQDFVTSQAARRGGYGEHGAQRKPLTAQVPSKTARGRGPVRSVLT